MLDWVTVCSASTALRLTPLLAGLLPRGHELIDLATKDCCVSLSEALLGMLSFA